MKQIFLSFIVMLISSFAASAQDYNIRMAGLASNGAYFVKVTSILDKKQNANAMDYIKKMAVDGVMLRGVAPGNGYSAQPALVQDPDIARIKAEWFEAFNRERMYDNFCSLEPSQVTVTQLPKKKFEVSALVTVDKERLIKYLTEHQIIKNFDSLW